MNNNPVISVVMSVYNGEKYLDEAIESILNQTYRDFEFIIINDGSTDKSLEIIEKYKKQDKRIVLISRENRGLIASLNEGIKKAKGKYIARMDADDISLPTRFEEQIKYIKKNELDICGSHFIFIDETGKYLDSRVVSTNDKLVQVILTRSVPFAHGSVIFKKDFMTRYKLVYGLTNYLKAEDYALWIQFYEKGAKFGNVDQFLFLYRDIESSLSKNNLNYIHAKKLSDFFIKEHKQKVLESIIKNKNRLNSFEQEHMSFFILKGFLVKYLYLLRSIPFKYNIINLLRIIFR